MKHNIWTFEIVNFKKIRLFVVAKENPLCDSYFIWTLFCLLKAQVKVVWNFDRLMYHDWHNRKLVSEDNDLSSRSETKKWQDSEQTTYELKSETEGMRLEISWFLKGYRMKDTKKGKIYILCLYGRCSYFVRKGCAKIFD